MTTEDY